MTPTPFDEAMSHATTYLDNLLMGSLERRAQMLRTRGEAEATIAADRPQHFALLVLERARALRDARTLLRAALIDLGIG